MPKGMSDTAIQGTTKTPLALVGGAIWGNVLRMKVFAACFGRRGVFGPLGWKGLGPAITTKGKNMSKKSKKYLEAVAKVPEEPIAPLAAMGLVKEISTANFDETVTADFRLGIDTRQADQQLRGTVSLPNGSGKTVRVAVFAEGEAARAAEEAGADIVGTDELMAQVQAGEFNFDAAVATPDQMGKVGRLGKILGPRGLMPNPKLGTVTNDVAKAINELKGGRVEYRADRYGIAHVIIGKVSFTPEQLVENYGAVYDEILRMKPSAAKGKYVKSITVASTMSPGVKVDSSVTRNYTETE